MKLPRRQFLHFAAGAASLPVVSRIASAQAYPSRPITIVAPFAAGGPVDARARILAEHMRQTLGQSVIVENVTGAAGSIGVGRVAHAAPDGYTIVVGIWSTHVVNGAIYTLSYDVQNDFEPIALITDSPNVIVGKKTLPANDLKGLIAWLKANPEKATAGTATAARVCHSLSERNGHSLPVRALSWWCAGHAGPGERANRSYDFRRGYRVASGACQQHQSLRCHLQEPHGRSTRYSDRG